MKLFFAAIILLTSLAACSSLGDAGFKPKYQPLLTEQQQYMQFLRAQQKYEQQEATKLLRKMRKDIKIDI